MALGRAAAAGVFGGLVGVVSLAGAYAMHPAIALDMSRNVSGFVKGLYGPERQGNLTYAWTSAAVTINLPGLDRRSPWTVRLRLKGGRPDPSSLPDLTIAVDGVTALHRAVANEFLEFSAPIPAAARRRGATVTLSFSNTFKPGPQDSRALGVMVDYITIRPERGVVLPPRRAMATATFAGAVFGAALGLTGLPLGVALAGMLLIAIAQAIPLSTGPALYSDYQGDAVWIAIWSALVVLLAVAVLEWWRHQPLNATATAVIAFSGGALYLKLLALLHPSKSVVDALFHAHRFEWVLAGRYYFTQPMPDGVAFPYAIALYLFAAPWSLVISDHVALLRVVVCASDVIAGALLYPMIVRNWGDRRAGAIAAVLFALVPLSYVIAGNANLTNAFGQAVSLVTMAAVTIWPLQRRSLGQLAGLIFLSALAFLSHVSTFPLLLTTLLALALFYRWLGNPTLRVPARSIVLATTIAAVFSMVSYYGQFGEVYERLGRVRVKAFATVGPVEAPPAPTTRTDGPEIQRDGAAPTPRYLRLAAALALGVNAVGWPILVLAIVGAWRLWVGSVRDRLVFALAAWGFTYLAFVAFSILAPVAVPYQRYVAEFIDRVNYATAPAAVILAAHGGMWAWRSGKALRLAAATLLVGAAISGVQQWTAWVS